MAIKRYFTFATPPDPAKYQPPGGYHYMSLPGGGYIAVLLEGGAVPADWVELPHLLERTAANFNGINTTAGAYIQPAGSLAPTPTPLGAVAPTDTTFQVAKKLASINWHFHP